MESERSARRHVGARASRHVGGFEGGFMRTLHAAPHPFASEELDFCLGLLSLREAALELGRREAARQVHVRRTQRNLRRALILRQPAVCDGGRAPQAERSERDEAPVLSRGGRRQRRQALVGEREAEVFATVHRDELVHIRPALHAPPVVLAVGGAHGAEGEEACGRVELLGRLRLLEPQAHLHTE